MPLKRHRRSSETQASLAALTGRLERLAARLEARVVQALERGAEQVAAAARARIEQGGRSGRLYTDGDAIHQASAPGEAPASRTGELAASLSVQPGAEATEVRVVADADYAAALEFGTTALAPRPFLEPALMENRDRIREGVAAAARDALGESGGR